MSANLHRDLAAKPPQAKSAAPAKPAAGPAKSSVTAPTPKVRPASPKTPSPATAPPVSVAPPVPAAPPPPAPAPAAPLVEVRLVGGGHQLAVTAPGTYALGRATDAPLRVKHPAVLRTHARIVLSEDRRVAVLEHAGGANGTRLNGRPIEKPESLSDGDEIGIGEVPLKVSLKLG